MRTLKSALYSTVHGYPKPVEVLAEELGMKCPSYLSRMCLDGPSGCRFPLDLLIPLMNITGNFELLDYLNGRYDRVTVSMPRVAVLKTKDPQAVNEITRGFNELMCLVLKFFDAPSKDAITAIDEAAHKHLCEVAAMRRAVKTFKQKEMF